MIKSTAGIGTLTLAMNFVNQKMADGTIKSLIQGHTSGFSFSNQSTSSIAEIVQSFWATNNFDVNVYRPWWRWSRAIASTSDESGTSLNYYKLEHYVPDMAATLIHEFVHGANFHVNPTLNPKMAIFGHGDNSPIDKENSAPYWIQDAIQYLAEKVYGG